MRSYWPSSGRCSDRLEGRRTVPVMADHTIRMSVPWVELGGQDVVFEVIIDDSKRGQLQISEGGLDWYPRGGRVPRTTSWEALARFLERDDS